MKKWDFFSWSIVVAVACFSAYIFLYVYPRRVSVQILGSGVAERDSVCYQKTVAIGGFKNTYQTVCHTEVEWNTGENAGLKKTVELPFPLIKGEGFKLYKITIYRYVLPPDKRYEYRR